MRVLSEIAARLWQVLPQLCLHPNTDCNCAKITRLMSADVWDCATPQQIIRVESFSLDLSCLFFFFFNGGGVSLKTPNMDHQGQSGTSNAVPSTPAFPVSPPTPYGE